MEDILEEIVGNIEDEHDEEENSIEVKTEDSFVMDGGTSLEEVEEILGTKLSDDYETLNGYLISLNGKIPEDGSSFTLEDDNYVFYIKNVSDKVIDSVYVRRKRHVE
jgi:putative hemolysin